MRGGEKVLEAICELYPDATIYTLVHVQGQRVGANRTPPDQAFAVQRLPKSGELYRQYLPLFPMMVELFDLDRYDLVISSSHCAAKSVIRAAARPTSATATPRCATPGISSARTSARTRWASSGAACSARCWRIWLGGTPQRPGVWTAFLRTLNMLRAGSADTIIADRPLCILPLIPPSIALRRLTAPQPSNPTFLIVSALVPYKRIDVAIEACRRIGAGLKIVGRGPEEARLHLMAGRRRVPRLVVRRGHSRPLQSGHGGASCPEPKTSGWYRSKRRPAAPRSSPFGRAAPARRSVTDVTGVLVGERSAAAFADGLERWVAAARFDRPPFAHTRSGSRARIS